MIFKGAMLRGILTPPFYGLPSPYLLFNGYQWRYESCDYPSPVSIVSPHPVAASPSSPPTDPCHSLRTLRNDRYFAPSGTKTLHLVY